MSGCWQPGKGVREGETQNRRRQLPGRFPNRFRVEPRRPRGGAMKQVKLIRTSVCIISDTIKRISIKFGIVGLICAKTCHVNLILVIFSQYNSYYTWNTNGTFIYPSPKDQLTIKNLVGVHNTKYVNNIFSFHLNQFYGFSIFLRNAKRMKRCRTHNVIGFCNNRFNRRNTVLGSH
jgi:hypothetical protein